MDNFLTGIYFFVFGTVLGSFLNVCIHRLPKDESIITRRSHCPKCNQPIIWYDNIPILSFLWLRGKCRHCQKRISIRYFIVELLSGLLLLLLWMGYGFSPSFIAGSILFLIMIGVFFADFETGYIPDLFTIFGMVIGLVVSALFPVLHAKAVWYQGFIHSALGLITGGFILLVTGVIGNLIYRRETMGGGDIKLLAMIGAFVGVKKVIFVFFFSPALAIPYALYAKFLRRKETIPFGPFIVLAAVIIFVWGDVIIRDYLLW